MLPKKRRVERALFKDIKKNGKTFHGDFFLLFLSPLPNKPSVFAFSVSKKVSKKAVDRNKIRRRGYSVISNNLDQIKEGFIFLFYSKKEAKDRNHDDLAKDIKKLLKKSNSLK